MPQINVGEINMLNEQEEIEKYLPLIWDMLEKSYENIGGLQSYRDYNDFKKKKHILMVVRDFDNGNLLACATFRRIERSLKMTAIGCNQEDNGKLALQQIVQHTISELELHYWTEVSGVIEYYFKKHKGFPMPNTIASKILGVPEDKIILSKKDMVHYDRVIERDREKFTKMIYGIKSEEIDAYLVVIDDLRKGDEFFVFRDRKSKERYKLNDEGIIISEKTADMLNVDVGDSIFLTEEGIKWLTR